ncbi:MAG: dihydrodipicolinate synthase family protein [Planctomycetota bacterium]
MKRFSGEAMSGDVEVAEIPCERPRRTIRGMSAVLLPFDAGGGVDWRGFEAHVDRTAAAGLTPAVNMDTGFGPSLDDATGIEVLDRTRAIVGGEFVGGVFVRDTPGAAFDLDGYVAAADAVVSRGGLPILFQSYGLTAGEGADVVDRYRAVGGRCGRFLAFELGQAFVPFGAIYDLPTFEEILKIESCVGAKHSSLRRDPEWERLALRDRVRPDFMVLTGNDLAIDMVRWGSDYLLGLSTFAPESFAKRDAMWAAGDAGFYELNDLLQYLGCFAFRDPVPAYKHDAAMFLKLRGWIGDDRTHASSPPRPAYDREVLAEIYERLKRWL